jgi:hypothetical protein
MSLGEMPVTNLVARLPEIETVRRWSQSLAMLDAILSPDWSYRYFSFNQRWSVDEQMASMRNGLGDEYSIVFSADGAYARGFDHESEMNPFGQNPPKVWPGLIDDVPSEFERFVTEPSFSDGDVPTLTVCFWQRTSDTRWRHGAVRFPIEDGDPDGADWLFEELDGEPETYRSYAVDYFEKAVELPAISHVYQHRPLTDEIVAALNPDLSLSDLVAEFEEIGYPTGA